MNPQHGYPQYPGNVLVNNSSLNPGQQPGQVGVNIPGVFTANYNPHSGPHPNY